MQIVTNNQPRDIVSWYELTDPERAELDYRDTEQAQDGFQGFRYKGQIYDLGEFMQYEGAGWDGSAADTFFSGILIRYVDDYERVIVARCYS